MPTPLQNKSIHPRTNTPRPQLPIHNLNPNLIAIDPLRPPPVKFQEIVRDGQATIVGRVKIATPNGHAFILRRLDTGAISLTTMFRASFPTATDDAEKNESTWVKANFDIAGANRSGKSRFAGTWVVPETAKLLADSYHLGPIIDALADANPDPHIVYRKSTRNQATPTGSPAATAAASPAQTQQVPAPQTVTPTAPAAKRRREASPSGIPVRSTPPPMYRSQASTELPSYNTATAATTTSTTTSTASSTTRVTANRTSRAPTLSPAPRRSARLKSPEPTPVALKTPRATRAAQRERERTRETDDVAMTPAGSDETAVDHDQDEDAHEAAKVAEVNMAEDVREQRELIERLKAERAQLKQVDEGVEMDEGGGEVGQKRAREEEKEELRLNIKEPETEERAIKTNRRVAGSMAPERKSLAWGALLFAAGLGAVSFLPSLPNFF